MAVFRNVMAFLGLDDDDQLYDDEEGFLDQETDEASSSKGRGISGRSGRGDSKTISLDDRFPGESAQPSFGFSTEANAEAGGVGAVRPLRPVPNSTPIEVPDALSPRPVAQGFGEDLVVPDPGLTAGPAGRSDLAASTAEAPADAAAVEGNAQRRRASVDSRGVFEGGGPASASQPPAEVLREVGSAETPAPQDPPASTPPHLRTVEENEPPVVTHAKPRLHIPSSFDDASRIADDFRTGSPVVMNLTKVDKPVARRLVDFASGVCYVLAGGMERLAPNVYLLTPTGVGVSPEDRRRMQERGFDR